MTTHHNRTLVVLPIAIGLLLIVGALFAGGALAEDMSGMPGMTDEEMQGMTEPAATPTAEAEGGHGAEAEKAGGHAGEDEAEATGGHAAMSGMAGSAVDWAVIGGFGALIAGATLAAAATKRHLRRRMLTGELAMAGVQDV